jgi:hypothetical protein
MFLLSKFKIKDDIIFSHFFQFLLIPEVLCHLIYIHAWCKASLYTHETDTNWLGFAQVRHSSDSVPSLLNSNYSFIYCSLAWMLYSQRPILLKGLYSAEVIFVFTFITPILVSKCLGILTTCNVNAANMMRRSTLLQRSSVNYERLEGSWIVNFYSRNPKLFLFYPRQWKTEVNKGNTSK